MDLNTRPTQARRKGAPHFAATLASARGVRKRGLEWRRVIVTFTFQSGDGA
jgi:hypothetical protein